MDFVERMFDNFSFYFPYPAEKAIRWEEYDSFELMIYLNDGSSILYDDWDNSIRSLPANQSETKMSEEQWRLGFSRRLLKRMRVCGFNQEMLAKELGVSTATISYYLNGKRVPNLYRAEKLAEILHCTVEDLLHFPK